MRSEQAAKRVCPFRFGRPAEVEQIGELKHVEFEDQFCIVGKCMAWELTNIQANYKDGLTGKEIEVTDNGYCTLMRQEAVEVVVMPHSAKTRAY